MCVLGVSTAGYCTGTVSSLRSSHAVVCEGAQVQQETERGALSQGAQCPTAALSLVRTSFTWT